jgi:hypothetical protein
VNGSSTPLRANSRGWAQQRAEVDVAERRRHLRLTTRIISSGVTPLAASDATNEPALVPT